MNEKILNTFMQYKEKYRNSNLYAFLDSVDENDTEKLKAIIKFLDNDNIMQHIDSQTLDTLTSSERLIGQKKYHKMLCDLIGETYGKDAEGILLDRPRITVADIPNFYIFDDRIRDMIGYGGVHTFMNYNMQSAEIIAQIAQNPELIKYYKQFEKVSEDMYPPSAVGLEYRLQAFSKHIDLIKQVMDSSNPEKYTQNLKTYIYNLNRIHYFNLFFEYNPDYKKRFNELFNIQTLQDLDGFEDKMNTLLDEMVENGKLSKHDIIEFKYLETTSKLDEEQYVREYNEQGSELLTDNEVNLIELSSINGKIGKILHNMKYEDINRMGQYVEKAYEDLYDLIRSEETQLSSFQVEQIREKIIKEYKTKYVRSLFSAEHISEEAERTEKRMQGVTTDNTDSQNRKVRRVIKKKDGNLYFADHMESMDGKIKTYSDYVDDGEYIIREYTYDDNKQFVRKDWNYSDERYRTYRIGDYTIRFKYSEEDRQYVFDAYKPNHERKAIRTRDKHVDELEEIIRSGKIVKQYNPQKQYKLEPDDSEFFIVDSVNSANLMLTAIRYGPGAVTSVNLQGKITENDDRIMVEKEFEGGQSTRSFYYHYNRGLLSSFKVALAFTNINPNAIIGVCEQDAMVTHKLKELNPSMSSMPISSIMDSKCNDGEIATLRYEWNLDDIVPRN